jgi:hypothetical protein
MWKRKDKVIVYVVKVEIDLPLSTLRACAVVEI